jgi:hypothetical protein
LQIETTLRDAVHATEDWVLHHLMHRTRRLIRAERASRADADPGKTTIGERVVGFARVRIGYYTVLSRDEATVAALRRRVADYDADLRAMGLEDYDLDRSPKFAPKWIALLLALQTLGVFLLLPPLVGLGYITNLPTALLLIGVARVSARMRKDEATVKLLLGLVLYPVTWIGAGVLAAVAHTELHALYPHIPDARMVAGGTIALLSCLGGVAAVRYWRVARETARAVRVRITRRRYWYSVARLRGERAELHDAIIALVQDVALPGRVAQDGRIHSGS